MSARAAGRVLAALAVLGAAGVLVVGRVHGSYDGLLVAISALGLVGGAVLLVRDARRGRAPVGQPGRRPLV
ncbi:MULTISPECIES: hypothetical protein [unclassified Actinotalea]|uniref:hypothetical protein n=1 Tax=unclassified Actinotalea TaxID=2638618 RepID=UPI0015F48222|nr:MULTISPECIES: hypothetical protein [unclassified Actinotalea]